MMHFDALTTGRALNPESRTCLFLAFLLVKETHDEPNEPEHRDPFVRVFRGVRAPSHSRAAFAQPGAGLPRRS